MISVATIPQRLLTRLYPRRGEEATGIDMAIKLFINIVDLMVLR